MFKLFCDKGNYRIEFYLGEKRKYFYPGTKDGNLAKLILHEMALDWSRNSFDLTLNRYKVRNRQQPTVTQEKPELSVIEVWTKYQDYKGTCGMKPKTIDEYESIKRKLSSFPICQKSLTNALDVRSVIVEMCTHHVAKRVLMQLAASYKWAVVNNLVKENPFQGMSAELPKYRYEVEPSPNPFTNLEKTEIIQAFNEHPDYEWYSSLVEFLFLTGCRPSEAIGLRWGDIQNNQIIFQGSIVQCSEGLKRVNLSKTNRRRAFPVTDKMKTLLSAQKQKHDLIQEKTLVFPSKNNKPIRYNNFCRRAWNTIVDPIKPDTTPYSCRDTFITTQIAENVPPAIIAKWCDTSVKMIEKYYLGNVCNLGWTPK